MEQIKFTTRVLGRTAAQRLEQHQVTQTLRSKTDSIVQAILGGRLRVGDQMHVVLDDRLIGLAQYVIMDRVTWKQLTIDDAQRGGFDTRFEMAYALKRADYRFKDLEDYFFWRCLFSWPETQELANENP